MNEAQRLAKAKADYEAALAETCRLKKDAEEKIKAAEVAKRTAKTVLVKIAGQPDERAQAFRIGKTGRWDIYPRQDLWSSVDYWIEFPDETSATDPV